MWDKPFSNPWIRKSILYASPVLYAVSLILPGLYTGIVTHRVGYTTTVEPMYGYQILEWGWYGTLGLMFAWFANATAVLAFLVGALLEEHRKGLMLSFMSVLLGLQTITLIYAPTKDCGPGIDLGAPLPPCSVFNLGIGYYVWMLSFVVLLGYFLFFRSSKQTTK
jgi:hypothetical protein